jgi:hypothetical protein
MTKNEFAAALAVLEAGIGKSLIGEQVKVWFDCLSDLPIEALQTGIKLYLCQGDDWPSIAKIRKLASSAMHGECLSFGEAFDLMISAVRKHGFYDEPAAREKLDDLTWQAVRGLGGWEAACDSPVDQRATMRAQFRMIYEGLRSREESHRALPEGLRPSIENPNNQLPESVRPRLPEVTKVADSMKITG